MLFKPAFAGRSIFIKEFVWVPALGLWKKGEVKDLLADGRLADLYTHRNFRDFGFIVGVLWFAGLLYNLMSPHALSVLPLIPGFVGLAVIGALWLCHRRKGTGEEYARDRRKGVRIKVIEGDECRECDTVVTNSYALDALDQMCRSFHLEFLQLNIRPIYSMSGIEKQVDWLMQNPENKFLPMVTPLIDRLLIDTTDLDITITKRGRTVARYECDQVKKMVEPVAELIDRLAIDYREKAPLLGKYKFIPDYETGTLCRVLPPLSEMV